MRCAKGGARIVLSARGWYLNGGSSGGSFGLTKVRVGNLVNKSKNQPIILKFGRNTAFLYLQTEFVA